MQPKRVQKQKHVPLRTCVVCRNKRDKRSLTRLVGTENGVVVDPTGKLDGRGAYLCNDLSCWQTAAKSKILNQLLRITLTEKDRLYIMESVPTQI